MKRQIDSSSPPECPSSGCAGGPLGARGPRREPLERFFILTTTAAQTFAEIHHRDPTIVEGVMFVEWLAPAAPHARLLQLARRPHWSGNQRQEEQDDE